MTMFTVANAEGTNLSTDSETSQTPNITIKTESDVQFPASKLNRSTERVDYFNKDLLVEEDRDEDTDGPRHDDVDHFLSDMDGDSDTSEVGDNKKMNPRDLSLVKNRVSNERHSTFSNSDTTGVDMAELHGGSVTLWQFLLELLIGNQHPEIIQWTSQEGEFMLLQAEEVARLWGMRKNKNHRMNYDKLSRALRYYYQKNIIKKVHGHKFVYRFVYLPEEGLKSFQKAVGGGQTRQLTPVSIDEGKPQSHSPAWTPASVVETDLSDIKPIEEASEVLPEIKVEHRPCCSCRCHDQQSETLSSVRESSNSPTSGPPAKSARLSHPLPPSHPTPLTPESAMHHERHTINMQRLAQQLRLQTQRSETPARRRSGPSSPAEFNLSTSPASTAASGNTSSPPAAAIPPSPFMDFSQARLYPPSGFPPASTSGQQCVWMPIPIAMLSRWWQSLANLSGSGPSGEDSLLNGHDKI